MSSQSPSATLYFEDLHVGQTFPTDSIEVTATEVVEFASRYDPQPFHLDAAAARTSVFGGLVASGWLTGALTMRLIVRGKMQLAGGLIGLGADSIHWPRAVRPGDRISAVSEIIALRTSEKKPQHGIVKIRTTTSNQHGEVVQILVANQLMLRRG